MTGLSLTVDGTDRLAQTAHAAADALGDLDYVPRHAAVYVLGHLHHPAGQPAGRAAGLHADLTPVGFTVTATTTSAPFGERFATENLDAATPAVLELYETHIGHLVDQIEGT